MSEGEPSLRPELEPDPSAAPGQGQPRGAACRGRVSGSGTFCTAAHRAAAGAAQERPARRRRASRPLAACAWLPRRRARSGPATLPARFARLPAPKEAEAAAAAAAGGGGGERSAGLRGAEARLQQASQGSVKEGGSMIHINDLPEDILLDLLSLVPGRDLIRSCRVVCSQWRDLVDTTALWKRKSQQEGYLPKGQDRSVPDWKIFYFLCIMKRNLIKNHLAEDGFKHWDLDSNQGDEWKIEDQPGDHGREFPHPHVRKYFVTSFGLCTKNQLIDLRKEGYWAELMDKAKPDIVVKDWYAARYDCGCQYNLNVKLLSADYIVLEEFDPESVVIEQWSDAEWQEMTHTFHNYPPGVRYIYFKHGGKDTQFWAGWYGVRVTNSSITIGPEVAS